MSREVGYRIKDVWDEMVEDIKERALTTIEGLSQRDDRALQRGRVNMLFRDRRFHRHTAMFLESEARHARKAWSHSMNCSKAVHAELQAYRVQKMPPKKTIGTTTPMIDAQIKAIIAQRVATALAEYEATRSRNGDDSHDSGTSVRRQAPPARQCTYSDFLKCQPLKFKGTKGVVGLTQWFEKMEFVEHISNYTVTCQIKYATCTLQGNALTWWNSHVKTASHEVTYAMTWKTLEKDDR
nr:hypothetical protein [Tanacetum cinerariifolium]